MRNLFLNRRMLADIIDVWLKEKGFPLERHGNVWTNRDFPICGESNFKKEFMWVNSFPYLDPSNPNFFGEFETQIRFVLTWNHWCGDLNLTG